MSENSKLKMEIQLNEPKMFSVIIYNDDVTTMDFVVNLLMTVFGKQEDDAIIIMLRIHEVGKSIIANFVYDIAVTKKYEAERLARENGFPLRVSIEEAGL